MAHSILAIIGGGPTVVGIAVATITWLLLPIGRPIYFPKTRRVTVLRLITAKVFPFDLLRVERNKGAASKLVFTEVASLLRAGIPPGLAWRRAAEVSVDSLGIPDASALATQVGRTPALAMQAAAKLALRLGAPLADVLLSVGAALQAETQAAADRKAALAGPRSTARLLFALPFIGILLGLGLGASPVQVVISGGIGTIAFGIGVALLVVGRWWIAKLVHDAEAAWESS